MKVLVTGATGLVGNNVTRLLVEQGQTVRVLARPTADARPFDGLDVERCVGDVRDAAAVRRACVGVDAVIHAAALVHFGWTRLDEQRQVNVDGTRHVAEAARDAGARLVHVSSVDALAAGRPNQWVDEDTPLAVKVPCGYVLTKREAEQIVLSLVESGLDATIVNPGLMLGPWDWKPSSGRMVLGVAREFTIAAPSGGISACDVRDVAAAAVRAMEPGKPGRRYILAGHNVTYLDLWRRIAHITNGTRPWFRFGPVVQRVIGLCGDLRTRVTGKESDVNSAGISMSRLYHYYKSDRAIAELDYRIRPLDESIQASWDWLREYRYV